MLEFISGMAVMIVISNGKFWLGAVTGFVGTAILSKIADKVSTRGR